MVLEVVLDADGVGAVRALEGLHRQVGRHVALQVPRTVEHPPAEVTRVQPRGPAPRGTGPAPSFPLRRGRLQQRRRNV